MSLSIHEYQGERSTDIQSGKTSTRTFRVTGPTGTTKVDVEDGLGIALGDADPEDSDLYCRNIKVSRPRSGDDNLVFDVTVSYTSVTNELTGVGSTGGDPLEADAVYSLDIVKVQVPLNRFADGDLITNVNGDPINGLTKNSSYAVMRVVRNEASYALSAALQYVDHVNSDTFYGVAAGFAYCAAINATTQRTTEGVVYFQVSYEIWINTNADVNDFKLKVLNEGKRKIVDSKLVPILYTTGPNKGQPVTEPVPLGNDGEPLDIGDPYTWIEGDIYPSVAFSGMNL